MHLGVRKREHMEGGGNGRLAVCLKDRNGDGRLFLRDCLLLEARALKVSTRVPTSENRV